VKWDGYRGIAYVEPGRGVRLVSRNLRDLTPHYPELQALSQRLGGDVAASCSGATSHGRPRFLPIERCAAARRNSWSRSVLTTATLARRRLGRSLVLADLRTPR
jgi:ATP-dependent DNA ligase